MRKVSMLLILAAVCVTAVVMSRTQPPPAAEQSSGSAPSVPSPEPAAGRLRFESSPAGAEVLGPDGVLGVTPFTVDVHGGRRPKSVVYRLDGHFTQQRTVPPEGALVSAKMMPR